MGLYEGGREYSGLYIQGLDIDNLYEAGNDYFGDAITPTPTPSVTRFTINPTGGANRLRGFIAGRFGVIPNNQLVAPHGSALLVDRFTYNVRSDIIVLILANRAPTTSINGLDIPDTVSMSSPNYVNSDGDPIVATYSRTRDNIVFQATGLEARYTIDDDTVPRNVGDRADINFNYAVSTDRAGTITEVSAMPLNSIYDVSDPDGITSIDNAQGLLPGGTGFSAIASNFISRRDANTFRINIRQVNALAINYTDGHGANKIVYAIAVPN